MVMHLRLMAFIEPLSLFSRLGLLAFDDVML